MQNFFVIGWAYFKLEHTKFLSNFEFDRNIVSGTGAWPLWALSLTWMALVAEVGAGSMMVWLGDELRLKAAAAPAAGLGGTLMGVAARLAEVRCPEAGLADRSSIQALSHSRNLIEEESALQYCHYYEGLVQDCGISTAITKEIPQSCTKVSYQAKFSPILIRNLFFFETMQQNNL